MTFLTDEVFTISDALASAEALLVHLGRSGDAARLGAVFELVEGRLVDPPMSGSGPDRARRSTRAS